MLEGVLAFLAGAVFGGACGALKFFLLWRPLARVGAVKSTASVMGRYGIGYAINIAALFLVFIFRKSLPFPFEYALIGTALAIVLSGKLYPLSKFLTEAKPEQAPEEG